MPQILQTRGCRHGPEALLEGWSPDGGGVGGSSSHTPSQGALLIFLPGAPEISRLQRLLGDSPTVRAACDAAGCQLRVMPLHGSLPTSQQVR